MLRRPSPRFRPTGPNAFQGATPSGVGTVTEHTLMRCDSCGRGYAARRLDDETVHLLAGKDECKCGHTAFSELKWDDVL